MKMMFLFLVVMAFASIANADVVERDVITGEVTTRPFTQQELDNIVEANARELPQRQERDALDAKKMSDIAALGNRAEMQAEAASANSVPALRDLVLKLLEIVYSNETGTID